MGLISRVSSRTYRTSKMPGKFESKWAWKANYFEKLERCIRTYNKFLLVNADNVSSKQFSQIRIALRGYAEILMGKNTMIKRAIRGLLEDFPDYERILPCLVDNVGFVFSNGDL